MKISCSKNHFIIDIKIIYFLDKQIIGMPATALAAGGSTYDETTTTGGIEVSAATQGTLEGGTPVPSSPKITTKETRESITDALDVGEDHAPLGKLSMFLSKTKNEKNGFYTNI
jgi:hypothetical protein